MGERAPVKAHMYTQHVAAVEVRKSVIDHQFYCLFTFSSFGISNVFFFTHSQVQYNMGRQHGNPDQR